MEGEGWEGVGAVAELVDQTARQGRTQRMAIAVAVVMLVTVMAIMMTEAVFWVG